MINMDKRIKEINLSPQAFIVSGANLYRERSEHLLHALRAFIAAGIYLFIAFTAQAQTDITELYQKMEQQVASGTLGDTEMFQKYDSLMMYFFTSDMEKVQHYFQEGIAFARDRKNEEKEASLLTSMGTLYCKTRVIDSVIIYLDQAWMLIEGKAYYEQEYRNHEARGAYFREISDYENAMNAYMKGLDANEKDKVRRIANQQSIENPIRAEVQILRSIAIIHSVMYNPDQTIEYLLKAIRLIDENPHYNLKDAKYRTFGSLADMYISVGRLEEAFPLLEEAYKWASANGEFETMAYQLVLYQKYYFVAGDLQQSLNYGKQALQLAEKINLPRTVNTADKALMQVYLSMKDYKSSLYHAERMMKRTREDDWYALHVIYEHLALNNAAMGNIKKATEYMIKYRDVIHEISNKNLHDALQEMEVKYDVQQKELEIARKQVTIDQQKKRQFLFTGGLIAAGLLLTLLVYIIVLRNRRNRELADMNATKDRFFSIISHDLKNPAVAQHNAIQLLLENSASWDESSLTRYYHKLLQSAKGQVELLYSLLDWAQLQTGRMPFQPAPFDLSSILQPGIGVIRDMADGKGVTLDVRTPETAIVSCDKNMLATVVRNLLTNAVKYTAKDGTVSLVLSPTVTGRTSTYTISVTDTGTGMSSEQIQSLFRQEKPQSRRGTAGEQGSGLGLIVCREFLHKHGSALHIESEEGKGSRFWFEI